jgi:hypothetical protein
VLRLTLCVLFAGVLVTQATTASPRQTATNQSPANQSPAEPQDPASVVFTSAAGMVLHAVKPASAEDYEAAMHALQEALAAAGDVETKSLASGWTIFRAAEADAKGNVVYVHMLDPAVAGVDYRPSLWLDKLLDGAPPDLLSKYRDTFATPPTKLSLTPLRK